ncbi:hypothetical protein ACOMHN_052090 [Nucella lapillus]
MSQYVGGLEIVSITNSAAADIELAMREDIIFEVEANNFEALSLAFMDGHCKAKSDRKLESLKFNWAV